MPNEASHGKHEETCIQCLGTGYLPHYAHIANGVCFTCGGTGTVAVIDQKDDPFTFVYFSFGSNDRNELLKVYRALETGPFKIEKFTRREETLDYAIERMENQAFAFGVTAKKADGVAILRYMKTLKTPVYGFCIYNYERMHPELFPGDPIAEAELKRRAEDAKRRRR